MPPIAAGAAIGGIHAQAERQRGRTAPRQDRILRRRDGGQAAGAPEFVEVAETQLVAERREAARAAEARCPLPVVRQVDVADPAEPAGERAGITEDRLCETPGIELRTGLEAAHIAERRGHAEGAGGVAELAHG